MPQCLHLPIKPVTRRPGLEADLQLLVSPTKLLDQPLDRPRPVLDLAQKPDLASSAALRNRHRVLQLCRIEGDIHFAMLSHGPSLHA
jgi:hypothetical protein